MPVELLTKTPFDSTVKVLPSSETVRVSSRRLRLESRIARSRAWSSWAAA